MRIALAILLSLLLLYAAVLGWLWWRQERLLFPAETLPADRPLARSPDITERWIEVPGARLHALHLRQPEARGLVFYLHGNAGNLESWFVQPEFYRRLGYDLFMVDYRGYGKSSGRIEGEAQLHADVRAAWDAVASAYAGRRRVLFGRSLGSGLAARLAADLGPGAAPELTVLISPYASLRQVAREHFPWVPPSVLRYPLRTDALIARVPGRLLLVHGERDEVIPSAHARALQALAPSARLHIVPGAAHNDLQAFPDYLERISDALRHP